MFRSFRDRFKRHYVSQMLVFTAMFGILALLIYTRLPLADDIFAFAARPSLKITDRHGLLLREILSPEGGRAAWLTSAELPPNMTRAVIAIEDRRFFSHGGIDVLALGRATLQNLRAGRVISGASTLTQQLVKQRFGYPRTLWGKSREMLMALRLEHAVTKTEILTQYLNRVSFANQTFGIEAAARLYFGKPAAHLTLAESVFLTGLIQAPSRLNPYRHFDLALRRQRALLAQMRARQALSAEEYQLARGEKIRLVSKYTNFKAPHFCEFVLKQLAEPPVAAVPAPAVTVVKTTLNAYLQQRVEEIVTTRLAELADYNVTNAAALVLDNRRGEILAFVGSQDYFNDARAGQVNGVLALRQPGSTLKPFTYQLALERALTPATLLPDIQNFPAAPRSFLPENYDRKFHGPVRLREALACSYNIPAYRLVEQIGVATLYQRLHQFGFDSLREQAAFYGPGLTLGNRKVTLWELTRAYSILARRGRALRLRAILAPADNMPPLSDAPLFSPRVAYLIAHILADRQAALPAFGEDSPLALPFPTAVKTGTSKDYRDNWTVGFTADYTVGVWVGNFDGTPMRRVSGITGAAPIYRDVMLALYRNATPINLLADPPPGLTTVNICPLSGKLPHPDCPHTIAEVFLRGTAPTAMCDMHRTAWVDGRDGLLTTADAPAAVKKVFVHFPPLYQSWAREAGYPFPPTAHSAFAAADAPHTSPRLEIVHPNDGDVYALDPILRREYQTVQFAAIAPAGIDSLTWYVDDEALDEVARPFQASWPLAPGTHRVFAEALWQGAPHRSAEITIHVVN